VRNFLLDYRHAVLSPPFCFSSAFAVQELALTPNIGFARVTLILPPVRKKNMNPPGQQNQIMLGYRLDSLTTFKNDVEARIPDMEKRIKFFNNLANENIQFEMVLRVAHHVFPRFMIANALQEAPWTKSVEMSELYINRGNMLVFKTVYMRVNYR
jgi:hypothetical protein